MRFKLPVILFFFISLSLLISLFSVVYAKNEVVVLGRDEVVDKDYFAAGDKVTISGTVNGDVYAAGGEILIDGMVNGDVIAAGGKITLRGSVTQNVRVAGGDVDIAGSIGRNSTVAGGNVTFDDSARLGGSLVVAGGDVSVYAPIEKGMRAGVGDLTLASVINGDVTVGVGSLTLADGAQILGNLEYYSDDVGEIPDGVVAGEIVHNQPPVRTSNRDAQAQMERFAFGWKIISLTSAFIIGLLLLKFAPGVSETTVLQIRSYPWRNLGIGLVALIGVPLASILLLVTVFGIPLAFIAMALYFVAIYLAGIYFSMFIGRYILDYFKKKARRELSLLLGLVVYGLITVIPIIGWFVSFVSMLIALGAFVVAERRLHLVGKLR